MNYSQLSVTTMQKSTRKLIQVSLDDDEDAHDKINTFLGKDADRRKEWIDNNIDFTNKDSFKEELKRER